MKEGSNEDDSDTSDSNDGDSEGTEGEEESLREGADAKSGEEE